MYGFTGDDQSVSSGARDQKESSQSEKFLTWSWAGVRVPVSLHDLC